MTEDLEIRVVRLETLLKCKDEARQLQAVEYSRRLDELNHAHEKQVQIQHTYVSQAVYDEKHEALQARTAVLEQWRANIMGRAVAIGVIGALFISILTALVVHNTHF